MRTLADDLRAELADFDQLRGGTLSTFDAASLEELSTVLVKARIARGWTQRQLAEAFGMAEQQIQRCEANDSRSTSLARLWDIAKPRSLLSWVGDFCRVCGLAAQQRAASLLPGSAEPCLLVDLVNRNCVNGGRQ